MVARSVEFWPLGSVRHIYNVRLKYKAIVFYYKLESMSDFSVDLKRRPQHGQKDKYTASSTLKAANGIYSSLAG